MPLQAALQQNNIDSFSSVRLIHIDTNWFYQVKKAGGGDVAYISVTNGKLLKRGDWLYAQYIARIFLEGGKANSSANANTPAAKVPDCCDAAELCVLNVTKGAPVKDVTIITNFDAVYQTVNRVLPVYRVSFDRPDGITIYVETLNSRFAFAADSRRIAFSTFFSLVHTWGWLQFLGKGKTLVEIFFAGLTFLTSVMGIYIFFTTKSKKVKGNTVIKARRTHRYVSIIVALFTLMFSFSGCYHALAKLSGGDGRVVYPKNVFYTVDVNSNIQAVIAAAQSPVTGLSLVRFNNNSCWQAYTAPLKLVAAKDLMKEQHAAVPAVQYMQLNNGSVLPGGDKSYALCLAGYYSGMPQQNIQSASLITGFDAAYSFADKILPVWKINYNDKRHTSYYVETSSGMLSKTSGDGDGAESYSFAFLHKHEFLSGFGKNVKDFSTMFWAAAQVVLIAIGLALYFAMRKNKRSKLKK